MLGRKRQKFGKGIYVLDVSLFFFVTILDGCFNLFKWQHQTLLVTFRLGFSFSQL